ncbi:MAG TPA: WecB/TagA/CpsF family glycosyltransferase [Geminicoccaceae bacterium]|nr:WecB/TagA/CpsF family glycosyltransferase [Geminicoccaceae bacterium]
MPFSGVGPETVLRYLEQRHPGDPFSYIVTPNVDHVVRLRRDDGRLRAAYEEADLCLCDSRIMGAIGRLSGVRLPVVTGSDLTDILFRLFVDPHERITVIGGTSQVIERLRRRHGLREIRHHNPPMGFIDRPEAVLEAARFIERWPSRFIFLVVGSPQQELLAHTVKQRGRATGTALCVGASILFLTGDLQRAPAWMQRARLEWLHRLASEPRRLWRRYLIEGPAIFKIAAEHMGSQRQRQREARRAQISIVVPTFRREHLLPRLLERCISQDGVPLESCEIVVVDNSPEMSAKALVLKLAVSSALPIRYVHEPRPGISHARNRGVVEAEGDLVAFIDDDELPARRWLAALLEAQRTHRADVVLGPVRPLFDGVPKRFAGLFKRFFTQSSESPTGTPVSPNTPFRLGRRPGCYRPMASNNALLVKARCFDGPEPFDPRLGLTGGEDTLFFKKLHLRGRRIVWCREALVHEKIGHERLTPSWVMRRKFRDGQITSSTCLLVDPPQRLELASWLGVGVVQLAVGTAVGAATFLFKPDLALRGLCTASTGLGKLAFLSRFRQQQYGSKA